MSVIKDCIIPFAAYTTALLFTDWMTTKIDPSHEGISTFI